MLVNDIEILKGLKTVVSKCLTVKECKERNSAIDNAIQALQEHTERKRGCGICNTAEIDKLLIKNFNKENELCFIGGNSEFPKENYAQYCPKCGRKLVEE